MRYWAPVLPLLLWATASGAADADQAGMDLFETKIRPVLVESCYPCHSAKSAAEKKLQGGLLLDTRAGLRRGGDSGPALEPGKPDESLLVSALRHESFEMPPKGRLPDSTIADFVKWIELGAPDPREGETAIAQAIDIEGGRQFWSFQPLKPSVPPDVSDAAWVQTPIDQFIRSRQQAAGVSPNPLADPRTLIRRAYYDLIGIPPAPEELQKWVERLTAAPNPLPATARNASGVSDSREAVNLQAYGDLIAHLLESQHYGERWARHWLDLARFAESNGYAFDKDRPNAFHYRDFVIRALNSDMPYDQFVRLQVAGDLLAPNDYDATAATGFVVAGPFTTQQTQKERERSRYEQLDDMVNTLGTTMLGLTLGCCRCHDHKYDPLPQRDYYALASCFAEVGFSDTGLDLHPEVYQQAKADFDAAHAPLVAARTEFEQNQLPARFAQWLKQRPEELPAPKIGVWHHLGPFTSDSFDRAFDETFAPETEIALDKKYQQGKLQWTPQPKWEDGQVHNTLSGDNAANYLFRIIESPAARKVSLSLGSDDAIKVWINGAEILKNKVARGAAPDQEKIELPLKKGRNQLLMKIVNGGGASGFYFKSSLIGPPDEVVALLKSPQDQWNSQQRQQVLNWYKTMDEEWLARNAAVEQHQKQEPKPDLTMIYAAKVRGTTYDFGADTYKVYFLARGNADRKQKLATPGFLQVLMTGDEQRWLGQTLGGVEADSAKAARNGPSQGKAKSARLGLADWLTDTEHGAGHLLARVIVNRLWYHHFGRGIVATPSDFGTRGQPPSHPDLLDWLAAELIRNGWKLKPIHALIMTSQVYMQADGITPSGQKHDPENLLFWRRQPRRLEAETIRDALLAVSGTLDRTMYGAGTLDQRNPRRSVYLTVKRSQAIPLLQLFDAPDTMQGVGKREESTVAPQALALLNSPLARDLAGKFAGRVRPTVDTPLDEAIKNAYQIALSRSPTQQERSRMKAFIQQQSASRADDANADMLALQDFCHLLLCTNEFVYVD